MLFFPGAEIDIEKSRHVAAFGSDLDPGLTATRQPHFTALRGAAALRIDLDARERRIPGIGHLLGFGPERFGFGTRIGLGKGAGLCSDWLFVESGLRLSEQTLQ